MKMTRVVGRSLRFAMKDLQSRLQSGAYVLLLSGVLSLPEVASGQGSYNPTPYNPLPYNPPIFYPGLVLSNYAGPVFGAIFPPSYLDPGPPSNTSFDGGINLTGAPVTVAGVNLNPFAGALPVFPVARWWHWTAPEEGVAEMNVGPLYPAEAIFSIPPGVPPFTATWPLIYVGPDQNNLTNVQLLPFSELPSTKWTSVAGIPSYLPADRTSWKHKFRFAVAAGQTYHIQLVSQFGHEYQFDIDLFPVGLLTSVSATNLLTGNPLSVEFVSSDTNTPVVSLEGFGGVSLLGTAANEPFHFSYSQSYPGVAALYALGTNVLGERVVSVPTNVTFRPVNDDFAGSMVVASALSKVSVSGDTTAATTEVGEPQIKAGMPASHSIWWRWTARYGVPTTITLASPDSRLAVYKGNNMVSLQRVLDLESGPPFVISFPAPVSSGSFSAEAGETYYIQAESSGIVTWNLDQQTLQFYPTNAQRGNVGWPLELSAVFYETDSPPVQVEFVLGRQFLWSYFILQEIGSLGAFDTPPFDMNWIPTNTGTYFVWARGTNSSGVVHEAVPTQFDIYAGNDDFMHPTTITPETVTTNFVFDDLWTSVENGEPLHGTQPVQFTRWWKWTPSRSRNMRVKASQDIQGLPVDVFTGDSLADLHQVAGNDNRVYMPGFSGIVRWAAKAGQTYYIRTDDTRSPVPDPAKDILLTLEPSRNALPGEVQFSLVVTSRAPQAKRNAPFVIARALMPDGHTPVGGGNYRAQLYAAPLHHPLQPAGTAQPFWDADYLSTHPNFAGTFVPAPVIVPDSVAGHPIVAQIRVWDANFGGTYESARANGGLTGISNVTILTAGSEEVGPAPLLGIKSFVLKNASL